MRFLLTILIAVSWVLPAHAQFTTSSQAPYNTPDYLVQDILLGTGVTAFNVQLYGDTATQLGFFSGGGPFIGIDSGLVLTTGNIGEVVDFGTAVPNSGAPDQGGFGPAYFGNSANNSLLQVSQSVPGLLGLTFNPATSVNDASVLEFDFVPSSDSVSFRYVFSSDEWNNFPCTPYNDVFGFFVSGPGITGTFPAPANYPNNAINIATVPGTNPAIPITISSIHPGGNSCGNNPLNDQFFVNNIPNVEVGYNGYTTVLTATFETVPCDTYHIALAIGDGTDGALDSGVFLEAKSFSAVPIDIEAVPTYNTNVSDSTFYEGCGQISLEFERFAEIQIPHTSYLLLGGNAIEGTDFATLPDSIEFNTGQATSSLNLDVFDDGITEGVDTLIISIIPDTTVCYYVPGDTERVVIYIHDRPFVDASFINDTIDCTADTVQIAGVPNSGVEFFSFMWGSLDTVLDTLFIAAPTQDTTLPVVYTDACAVDTLYDTAFVIIENPPLVVNTEPDTLNCTQNGIWISPTILSGSLQQVYLWSTGDTTDSIFVSPTNDSVYYLTITDACNSTVIEDSIEVYNFNYPLIVESIDDSLNCTENSTTIGVTVLSGNGQHTYSWDFNSFINSDSVLVAPTQDSLFIVTVTDPCQASVIDSIWVRFYDPPLVAQSVLDTIDCNQDSILVGTQILSGTNPSFVWDNGQTTDSIWVVTDVDTLVEVIVTDACDSVPDTVSVSVHVNFGDPLTLSISNDTVLCPGNIGNLVPTVTGGFGPYNFSWDNAFSTDSILVIAIPQDTSFQLVVTDQCGVDTLVDTALAEVRDFLPLDVSIEDTTFYCPSNQAVIYPMVTGGAGNYSFVWSAAGVPGVVTDDSLVVSGFSSPITWYITAEDTCGVQATDSMEITTVNHPALQAQAMNDTMVCFGESLQLSAFVNGGAGAVSNPVWYGLLPVTYNGDSSLVSAMIIDTITYYVRYTDDCGNSAFDSVFVSIKDCSVQPPNILTPNGDGVNDFFYVADLENYAGMKLWIYNRWGELMFYDNNYRNNWGGEFLSDGVYFWKLDLPNGEQLSGYVHLFH